MDKYLFPIDITIYEFIGRIYDFLMDMARVRVFDNEQIQAFARNIYVVIGIVMIFKVVIILLSIVINPARAFHEKEGTAGPAASRFVITIVLILTVPLVFSLAYDLQNAILEENVIPKIITGVVGNNDLGQVIKDEAELCVYEPINLNKTYEECMYNPTCGIFDSYNDWYDNDFNKTPIWPFDNGWSRLTTNDMVATDLTFETFYNQFYIDKTLLSNLGGTNVESKYRIFLNPKLPIQYDLGLSPQENSITFLINGGNKEISFYRAKNIDTEYSKRVCRPFAMIAYNADKDLLDLSFSESYDRGLPLLGREFNNAGFKLVDWETSGNVVTYTLTSGKMFSISILRNFLELSDETPEDAAEIELVDAAVSEGNFTKLEDIMLKSFNRRTSQHNYILIISTLVGFGLLLLLISICFDMALRVVKLGFLQLTAPIPITSYIGGARGEPKVFNKWVKVCLTTYADVFIRVAALSFAAFILQQLTQYGIINYEEIFTDNSAEWILELFIIFGALSFVKILPNIVAEIFGGDLSNSGNLFEFNPLKKMQEVPLVGAGIGLGAGAIGGLIGGAATGKGFGGKALGALRGAFTGGFKGAQKVPLEGFQPGAKVPFGQTLTPFTAGQTGYKRAEAGNRVAQAKGERRQARATQSESQSNYNRVSNQREHADYGMRENIERRDRFSSMNEQLNPRHDIASQNYNVSEQRYNNAVSNASQLNQQLGEVRTRKQNLNENIASLCEQRTQVSEAFERAKSSPDFINDTRDYQSELDQLTSYINSGVGEITNLNREESQLINDVSVVDQEVEQARTDRDATLADLIDISHEMANNEEEVRDSEETIGYYEQVITDSDNEMAQHQREIEQAQGNIDSAQSRVANAKNERRKVE
ncbi:MAG: hypothetical protein PHS45_04900 [Bacilli bacterium]|nr:hypothetical protein [Bacilli bacterium]